MRTAAIPVSSMHGFYLNPDAYAHRTPAIATMVGGLGLASARRVAHNHRDALIQDTMSRGHLEMLRLALADDLFPALLFEDDATLMQPFPRKLHLPPCTMLYLGGSLFNCPTKPRPLRLEAYDETYHRVFFMQSAHAVLVPDAAAARRVVTILERALWVSMYNDIGLARASESHLFLVPAAGNYFFQDDAHTRGVTHFFWSQTGLI